jgi:two-component system, cell cycle response regulator DivK
MKAKILLVEDNENNRYLAKFLLEREGLTVDTAENGFHAIEMAAKEKPDLIVMDIQMPEMDGYETARRLKSDPGLSHIPIVGVSSYAMPGDRDKAIRSGFTGYIEKPVNPETFGRDIMSYLNNRGEPS